ncbi:MAG: TIR domain-containing protein [Chloroflexi bacterium]|nr:TIR domain-containing protein [Chloroflexota bacterium]
MLRIFISYRRSDSAQIADMIYQRFAARLGKDNVFKDVNSIPVGRNFRAVIEEELLKCDIMVVLIGPTWLSVTDAQDASKRRLDDPDDAVRTEVELGLRHVQVIPVLVNGAHMPGETELPLRMAPLSLINAPSISEGADFERQVRDFLDTIAPRRPIGRWLLVAAILLIAAGVLVFAASQLHVFDMVTPTSLVSVPSATTAAAAVTETVSPESTRTDTATNSATAVPTTALAATATPTLPPPNTNSPVPPTITLKTQPTPANTATASALAADAPERVRKAAFNITLAFEGSHYDSYQNYDSGIVNYGEFGFSIASGNLATVIDRYTTQSGSDTADQLRTTYLQRVRDKDAALRSDTTLRDLLITVADDPIMQAVQDEVGTELYWNRVQELSIQPRGIETPLGQAFLFDTAINQGFQNAIATTVETQLGVPTGSRVGANGITEAQLISAAAQFRRDLLYQMADSQNLPALKLRADFWVNRIAEGDWQLQGDADGNVEIRPGRLVQVQNPDAASPEASETPAPSATATPYITVITADANVRSGDGLTYPVILSMTAGESAPIIGISARGTWYEIRMDHVNQANPGTTGWIAPSNVETTGDLSDVPKVLPTTPAP